jgi:hypothetical protein
MENASRQENQWRQYLAVRENRSLVRQRSAVAQCVQRNLGGAIANHLRPTRQKTME